MIIVTVGEQIITARNVFRGHPMLEQAILYALRHLWESYWFLIVSEALIVSGLTMLIGSARW